MKSPLERQSLLFSLLTSVIIFIMLMYTSVGSLSFGASLLMRTAASLSYDVDRRETPRKVPASYSPLLSLE